MVEGTVSTERIDSSARPEPGSRIILTVVGAPDVGDNAEDIAVNVGCLAVDLKNAAGRGEATSIAEIIMHLCADIIAIERANPNAG
jgi:hypothetical protein